MITHTATNGQSNEDDRRWWWLAINGSSCAANAVAMPATVKVSPTPEQLLGFRTRKEQIAAQRLLLTAPIEEVQRYMTNTVPSKFQSGEVAYVRPRYPEPPTQGPTQWALAPHKKDA